MKTTLGSPADSAGTLYFRTDISPEQIFQAIGRLRKEARDEIDRLIRFLDDTDNHMELEPSGDEEEPSLGWPEGRQGWLGNTWHPNLEDREQDDSDDEDGGDNEPSLGFLERHPSVYGFYERSSTGHQLDLCAGLRNDLEDEHDGGEPDEEGEPSLGWTVDGDLGGFADAEQDVTECA